MSKFVIAAAAVLLTAGVAFAQSDTPPAPGAGPAEAAPAAAPFNGGEAAEPGARPGRPDGMRGHYGKKMHPRGGPHGDRHGRGPHGGMMMHPSKGASFMFAAPGEGRILIKCADEDSTQACADAVKPLLEMMRKSAGE